VHGPKVSKLILPVIVFSQFCCTSLWFASNAAIDDLVLHFSLAQSALGHLSSAVQFGFIVGTLVFALLAIADRYSPSKVFFVSALLGAAFNIAVIWDGNVLFSLLLFRFLTGFFLAGIYPVGMKIASDYYKDGLGTSLGYLVGALVLGTAFPHGLHVLTTDLPHQFVFAFTSSLAVIGGAIMWLKVNDGPFRTKGSPFNLSAIKTSFSNSELRSAAIGYFGHMWELYAFWAFIPVILAAYLSLHPEFHVSIPILSFFIIASGAFSCVIGGYLSLRISTIKTAQYALSISCLCCLLSPILFLYSSPVLFMVFLFLWAMAVIADSPMFSTLVAKNTNPEARGTVLTLVNCIGFSITIISIQLLNYMAAYHAPQYLFILLGIGPLIGLSYSFYGKDKI
jgi:MFS family permease